MNQKSEDRGQTTEDRWEKWKMKQSILCPLFSVI